MFIFFDIETSPRFGSLFRTWHSTNIDFPRMLTSKIWETIQVHKTLHVMVPVEALSNGLCKIRRVDNRSDKTILEACWGAWGDLWGTLGSSRRVILFLVFLVLQ